MKKIANSQQIMKFYKKGCNNIRRKFSQFKKKIMLYKVKSKKKKRRSEH